ncbi:uncharacterized protein LOC115462759 [Microcaecilia unicolor]|uniref:Uncharacterized protein LOC115462759 n=1 Tax=Microcaecilia unicolor TaxID=1415580 RepID=A0A6P7X813_9AMPH|nr:uncharacterized protein LOC115462759 [Microcaecilia unicolor]
MVQAQRWQQQEVATLLDLIHESSKCREMMFRCKKPQNLLRSIRRELKNNGYQRTMKQCGRKWQELRLKFYETKSGQRGGPLTSTQAKKIKEIWEKAGQPLFNKWLPEHTVGQETAEACTSPTHPHVKNQFQSFRYLTEMPEDRDAASPLLVRYLTEMPEDRDAASPLLGAPQASTSRQQDSAPPQRQQREAQSVSFSISEASEEEEEEENDEETDNLGMRKKMELTISQLKEELEAMKNCLAQSEDKNEARYRELLDLINSNYKLLQKQNKTQFQALQDQNKIQFQALFQAVLTHKRTSSQH